MRRIVLPLLVALLACAACVKNPATGKRQLSLVSQKSEINIGQEAADDVEQKIGIYPDAKLDDYVSQVGMSLAKDSERPNLPWSFKVLDDSTVNAFALPGGPVYITRGLLTNINNEAELAAVLGHEIGHVTAKHSVSQMSKAELANVGLTLGAVFVPGMQAFGQVVGIGVQLLFLRFTRDAERQADELGFKYAYAHGYDVREMNSLFQTLEKASQREGGQRLPTWLSTHPQLEDRVEKNQARLAELGTVNWNGLKRNDDAYLDRLNGVVYGDDPKNGSFEGNTYRNPANAFQVTLPPGWKTRNLPQSVVAVSPQEDAVIQVKPIGAINPAEAQQRFFAQQGIVPATPTSGPMSVGGAGAASGYFKAQTESGVIDGLYAFVPISGKTYQVVGYTAQGALGTADPQFRSVVESVKYLDPNSAAAQPARIQIVTLDRDMTLTDFNTAYPSTVPLQELAEVNGVSTTEALKAGRKLKRITGGPPIRESVSLEKDR